AEARRRRGGMHDPVEGARQGPCIDEIRLHKLEPRIAFETIEKSCVAAIEAHHLETFLGESARDGAAAEAGRTRHQNSHPTSLPPKTPHGLANARTRGGNLSNQIDADNTKRRYIAMLDAV